MANNVASCDDISLDILPNSATELEHHVAYIWMSVGTQQLGHAPLLLSNGVYISWWPKGKKMKCGPLAKEGEISINLQEDIDKEIFEPDYKFYIPSDGLDVAKMDRYWHGWQQRGHYALLNRNCCSMVYRVLLKGGAPRSATLLWRPETLRRYLVIYLGGGSRTQLFWNWSRHDEQFKESHKMCIWETNGNSNGHVSLYLEGKFYISWWPFLETLVDDNDVSDWVGIQRGSPSSTEEQDIERIGRAVDNSLTFRPKHLDVSEMKRRWAKFIGEEQNELWGANSFWVAYQVLLAGGAPAYTKDFGYWNGNTLQKYVKSNFSLVTE